MNIYEGIERCRLTCGSEAITRGLPAELGYELHDGAIADDLDGWSDEQYLNWIKLLKAQYSIQDEPLMSLYQECSKILGRYAELFSRCTRS